MTRAVKYSLLVQGVQYNRAGQVQARQDSGRLTSRATTIQ